jgi:HlyD family secretion protein
LNRALVWVGCGLIAGAGLVMAVDASGPARTYLTIPPAAAAADPGPPRLEPIGVGALGRVEPASSVRRIGPPGTLAVNRLHRLMVTDGQDVTEGELLAEFADAPVKDAAVEQAAAAMAEAEAQLARIKAGGRPSDVRAQRDHIAALTAQQDMAQRDAERARTLVPTGAGALAVAERAEAAASRAAALRREALATLESLIASRPEDIALAEAHLQSAVATSARAREDAALSRVFAPVAGKVLKVYAHPGDLVGADGLLDLADLSSIDVVADVYETDLPRVHLGASAEVIVPGITMRYTAKVDRIGWLVRHAVQANTDPVAAVDARTVEVRLALDKNGSTDLRHRINMQVQVAIQPVQVAVQP